MSTPQPPHPRMRRRSLQLEVLQRRDLMTVESLAWNNASSLRLSFVPDGTVVGDQVSNLDSVMNQSPAGALWRDSVVKAFQIWAQHADINVGVVSDSGDPIGTLGPVRGDDRFGEIRVSGIEMTPDTWAAAVDHQKLSAGSWSGDLFFNTAADWNQQPDDLLRVALHEAGHVLGLPHSDDVNSPMHTHGIPSSLVPTAADISLLQQMYGVRHADPNETDKSNDKLGDATRMRFSDVSSHFDGTKPLVHYGEVTTSSDRDVFFFEVPQDYHGKTTVHIVSKGMSQLQFRFTVKDINGNSLLSGDSTAAQGGEVRLQLPAAQNGAKYYLQIDAIGDALHQFGSYAVIAELDDRVTIPFAETQAVVQRASRWFASSSNSLGNLDVGQLAVSQHNGVTTSTLVDDHGSNDSLLDATRIDPFMDTTLIRSARTIGSISSVTDVDYFRFRSPKPPTGKTFGMLVQVDAIERNGLLPKLDVIDELGNTLSTQYLVNGNGEVKLWVAGVKANNDYTVRIRGVAGDNNIGNYELSATFQESQPTRPVLSSQVLTSEKPEADLVWYVARPQLFTWALDTTNAGSSIPVWATIFNSQRQVIANLSSVSGEFRTGDSLLLMPGTYYLQLGARFPDSVAGSLTTTLVGTATNDPLGPPPVDPATTPIFTCPNNSDLFCYPPDIKTTEPFVLLPEPPIEVPSTAGFPITIPSDGWFYNTDILPHNSAQPNDTSLDGSITALDALLVINFINASGPRLAPPFPANIGGKLDVNNDGSITALDALLVINAINSRVGGEGEVVPAHAPDEIRDSLLANWEMI